MLSFRLVALLADAHDQIHRDSRLLRFRLRFGVADVGAGKDLERVQDIFTRAVMSDAAFGFSLADGIKWSSESLRERQEYQIAANLELCCHRAEQIVASHRAVLDALTQELLRKGLLVAEDVQRIVQGAS